MEDEKRYSKKDLMKLWGVSRYTISEFEKRGLNFIEISSHSKYITKKDLLEFENSKRKSKL